MERRSSSAGRRVLSTLFSQVSMKAERELVLLAAGALHELHSKVTDTAVSDPSDVHKDGESLSRKKIALERVKGRGGH